MTDNRQHVDPFHDPDAESLAEALRKFDAMPDETPSRKARARAAVATFSRLLHKPSEETPAQAMFLKHRFARLKHLPTGLTAKSLSNCKSELRYLVRKVCGRGRRSVFRPLSADWIGVREAITNERLVWKLSRFMAFCSAVDVPPRQVNDGLIEQFRTAVHESDEVTKPAQHVRQAIRAWNDVAYTLPDLGLPLLFLPPRRIKRWTIEPERFPEPFQQQVAAWLEGLSKVDPEAEEGPIRPLRPESLRLRRHQIFKAASALVFSGRPIETITSLACVVDLDAFKAILKHLRERQGGEPTTALHGLATGLKYVAKHQVKLGDADLKRITRICANYEVADRGLRSKNRARLTNFDDERLLGALFHLPDRLLDDAAHRRTKPHRARILAQVAVAIEIELHTSIRLANLVSLNLRRNIQRITVRGESRWVIRFDRHETKNRSLLTYELSGASVKRIERGFKFYACVNGWLFPGGKGAHKLPSTFGRQIKHEVERRLGQAFNVHLFRGLVATTQIRENDNGFEIARAILGDRSDRVIRAHYTSTAEQHLIRKAQETIQRVRIRTAPLVPRRS